jgi:enoyl-CoA hydratase
VNRPTEDHLVVESHGPVRLVAFNRPDTLNAVTAEIHGAMARVWRDLAEDSEARAVVITGRGRAFSAGGDMAMFQRLQTGVEERRALLEEAAVIVREMTGFPLPVVAAVNGAAVGLGCSVALLCDLVFMAESAYLCDPHVAVGLTAGDGGASTWPLFMSLLRAKEFLLTGDRIPADQAVALGLANRVVPDDQLLDEAMEMAQRLAALPPQAVQSTKRALNLHLARAAAGVLEYALAAEYQSFDTEEHRRIVERFLSRS